MFKKIVSLVVFISALSGISAQAQEAPDALVRRSTNEILAAMKADKDLQAGNQQKIEKLAEEKVLPYFNFARMTQLARGERCTEEIAYRRISQAPGTHLLDLAFPVSRSDHRCEAAENCGG